MITKCLNPNILIDFSLSPLQKDLYDSVVDFARNHLNDRVEERDLNAIFDRNLWNKCAEFGLVGALAPESLGGKGFSAVDTVIMLEALGYGSEDNGFNFSIAAHLLASLSVLVEYSTEAQRARYFPGACDGTWILTNAITEETAGSDAFNMKTEAIRKGEYYILNGSKNYCSNGPVAGLCLVYARTSSGESPWSGITCFGVPVSAAGVRCGAPESKLGLRTCPMGSIQFESVMLTDEDILGGENGGASVFNRSMIWERTCLGALHIGTMQRLLERTLSYSKSRRSGSKTISTFQAISHVLAQTKIELEAGRSLLYRAAWALDHKKDAMLMASINKTFISQVLERAMLTFKQIYAGAAFRGHHEMERTLRDSLGATIYSGTTEIQYNIISRMMGL